MEYAAGHEFVHNPRGGGWRLIVDDKAEIIVWLGKSGSWIWGTFRRVYRSENEVYATREEAQDAAYIAWLTRRLG